jgi:hypothetical protein
MRIRNRTLMVWVIGAAVAGPAQAAGASQHLSNALANSLEAVAQSTVGGLKLVSGAVAIPLMIAGEIGKASGEAGEELWQEANTPIGEPLLITDDVITAGPRPSEVMKESAQEQPR